MFHALPSYRADDILELDYEIKVKKPKFEDKECQQDLIFSPIAPR